MDNFEKIELIVKGWLKERKRKLEICRLHEGEPYGDNPLYILGVQHDVDMLSRIAREIDAIKQSHRPVGNEKILKMHGSNNEP